MEIDLLLIYDTRTRQYMHEVMSCYEHKNYRSAIVLLNSVCLSDLFYKLQELRDIYSDGTAASIIKKIEEKISRDKQSAAWEKMLVEEVFNNLHLLDSAGYTVLVHLHDYRNLTAHPVLDGSSNLYQPSKELVESCISEAYTNILIKPSIFVKNIVSFMSEDLDSKKGYILDDREGFKQYIDQRYLKHMNDPMVIKVFRAFWKFTFVSLDDSCRRNRKVNLALIGFLSDSFSELLQKDIADNNDSYSLIDNTDTILMMMVYLANHPKMYKVLSPMVKTLIDSKVYENNFYKMISWFKSENLKAHIDTLISQGFIYYPSKSSEIEFFVQTFEKKGENDALHKYSIHLVRNAGSFANAIALIDKYITPNLKHMAKERLEDLILCYNENNQVYGCYYYSGYCGRVWEYAKQHFTEDYIKKNYPRFLIPKI